jgi:cytochrome c oxidase subunit 1
LNSTDLYLHDTYYIIAHFHYIVAPTDLRLFAGFITGSRKRPAEKERFLAVHWPTLICMNGFFTMFCRWPGASAVVTAAGMDCFQ